MKRNTFRLVIVLATVSILGISALQVYWFRQAFDVESDQFDREVTSALHQVANRFFEINQGAIPTTNPIRQLSSNYYVVMINNEIDANLLEYLLTEEFEKRDLHFDFEYGIYDCTNDEMVYGNYVSISNEEDALISSELPKWENQAYYFGVNFPQRGSALINRLDVWIFSTFMLLLVILFFAYSLITILRQKRLREIQKDFINTMTHEFKTPISTISISANVLKDPAIVGQPERLLNYATIIENENNRMKQQVERVLQIATMDRSDIHLKREEIDLHELIRKATEGVSIACEKELDLKLQLEAENSILSGDRLHLSNVLYNLVDNAAKYSIEPVHISIITRNEEGILVVDVMDKGIGIAQDQVKKIFQKFYRVPTGNVHDARGFGLGLSYVSLIAEAHKGSISVVSTPGKGSSFTLRLPLI